MVLKEALCPLGGGQIPPSPRLGGSSYGELVLLKGVRPGLKTARRPCRGLQQEAVSLASVLKVDPIS